MGKRKRSALACPLPMRFYGFFISLKIWKVPHAAVPDFARAPRKAIENTLPGQGLLRIAVSFCKGPGQRCLLCFPIGAAKSGQKQKARQLAVCARDFAVFFARRTKPNVRLFPGMQVFYAYAPRPVWA